MTERHVQRTRADQRGWSVLSSSGEVEHSWHTTQADAIAEAEHAVAARGGGTVVIHGLTGNVVDRRTIAAQSR